MRDRNPADAERRWVACGTSGHGPLGSRPGTGVQGLEPDLELGRGGLGPEPPPREVRFLL